MKKPRTIICGRCQHGTALGFCKICDKPPDIIKQSFDGVFRVAGDLLRELWASGKPIQVGKKKYSVHKMSYGDYFLEPFGRETGERDPSPKGTLWLEKIDPIKNIFGIEK